MTTGSTWLAVAVVGVLLGLAVGQTDFKDCGSKYVTVNKLAVGDCTKNPCQLKRGTNVTVEMVLQAKQTADNMVIKVVAKKGIIHLNIPVPDPNACHFMKCPMVKGSTDTFKGVMAIGTNYPRLEVTLEWRLTIPNVDVSCVSFDAQLV